MNADAVAIEIINASYQRSDADRVFELRIPYFKVHQSAAVALVGPSGCGKSSMLALLSTAHRFDHVETHRVEFGGADANLLLGSAELKHRLMLFRRFYLGYVPEGGSLLNYLTIRENCQIRAELAQIKRQTLLDRLDKYSTVLGIDKLLDNFPDRISGGERQRASLLQAIIHHPTMIIADEPTAALHPAAASDAMGLFVSLAKELGIVLIISTHDRELAQSHGFQIVEGLPDIDDDGYSTTFQYDQTG